MGRKLARPRGKQYFPITITLSQEQIDYLKRQPNVSALIRKILDDLITSEKGVEEKLGVITLNLQLKSLQEKLEKLCAERHGYMMKNYQHWQLIKNPDGSIYHDDSPYRNTFIDWADQSYSIPKPLDTEDAKVAFRVLQDYDKAINYVQSQIAEIKQKILQS